MKVVLMGYMGSGKSTIGKLLANTLNYTLIDLDDYIIAREKIDIPEIFKTKGEIYFRKKEHECLKEIMQLRENLIVSLGGGTPCYGANMNLIVNSEDAASFYLKASIDTLAKRLFEVKANRPLISHLESIENLKEYIGKHLFERAYYYNQAQFIIDIDNKSEKDIVEQIIFNLF
jgi:shikimate kinase